MQRRPETRETLLKRIERHKRKRKRLMLTPTAEHTETIAELDTAILGLRKDLLDTDRCIPARKKRIFRRDSTVIDLATRKTAVATYIDEINDVAEITFSNGQTKIVHDIQRNLLPWSTKYINYSDPLIRNPIRYKK